MSDVVTPGAAPDAAQATPTKPTEGETVTIPKSEHEQLSRDAARAASAQSRADRLEKVYGRSNGNFRTPVEKAPEPTKEERDTQAVEEDRKAERGLLGIALDPAYREVLDADPTLRNIFTKNPLAVLPLLAPDALDAEDAMTLVKEKLEERKNGLKKPEPKKEEPNKKAPSSPPAGGINATATEVNEQYEAAKKLPGVENAIAGMVKANLKKFGSTKS